MKNFLFVVSLNLLCFVVCVNCEDTVKVSLYYESLCPDCMRFDREQLYPVYKKLHQYLELELIPYGNAKRTRKNDTWIITCQHGEEECYENKIHACALASHASTFEKNNFIECTMSSNSPASVSIGQQCAEQFSLDWNQIHTCALSDEGTELLVYYGEITDSLNPPHTYVPWILFNGVFNQTMNDQSQDDFLTVVCSLYEEKPAVCPNNFEEEELISVNLI